MNQPTSNRPEPFRRNAEGHFLATLTELKTRLHDVVAQVAVAEERVYLERHGKIVAVLVHPEDLRILDGIEDRELARRAKKLPRPKKGERTYTTEEVMERGARAATERERAAAKDAKPKGRRSA